MKRLIDTADVRRGVDQPGCQERFDLRREDQPVAVIGSAARPVQRTDAETVAGENDDATAAVVERDGELTAQCRQEVLTVLFPEMRQDLDVGGRPKMVTGAGEPAPDGGMIEALGIGDGDDGAVFVLDRLLPAGDVDDRQASHGEPDGVILEEAVAVGATMHHGRGHALEAAAPDATAAGEVDDSRYAAHRPFATPA